VSECMLSPGSGGGLKIETGTFDISTDERTVKLSGRPKLLILSGNLQEIVGGQYSKSGLSFVYGSAKVTAAIWSGSSAYIQLTDTGFTCKAVVNGATGVSYIAFM